RRIARAVVVSGCLALAVTMAWYIRAYLLIRAGVNGSEVQWVTSGIYHGQSVLGRMGHAALHIAHDRKSPWVLLVLILAALSLRAGSWRIPVFGLAAGYLLLWSAFFSYDGRNASLALPLIGLLAGEGLVAWRPVIMRWLAAIRLSRAGWKDAAVEHVVRARPSGRIHWGRIAVMLVVGLLLVVAARKITTGRLEARQRELEIAGIGKPGVNALLTTAMDGASQSSTILGTYKWACVIKRIRRGHPCRMVNAPDQVSVAIADGNALVLAIPTKWIEGLQTSLQHRLIVEIGTADGYAVWRSEN
ncbi:MAG TPA: hypothetical protein VKB51_14080, partial [bacterium]|nr:hypothetical protein [bacterium]